MGQRTSAIISATLTDSEGNKYRRNTAFYYQWGFAKVMTTEFMAMISRLQNFDNAGLLFKADSDQEKAFKQILEEFTLPNGKPIPLWEEFTAEEEKTLVYAPMTVKTFGEWFNKCCTDDGLMLIKVDLTQNRENSFVIDKKVKFTVLTSDTADLLENENPLDVSFNDLEAYYDEYSDYTEGFFPLVQSYMDFYEIASIKNLSDFVEQ